jgi:tetratricopeptide (TPR) repeat protein
LADESVAIGEAGLKARGEGAFAFPSFLLKRSSVELASGNTEHALADSNRALALLQSKAQPGSFSNKLGYAYLACARALDAQGKHDDARTYAKSALEHLEKSVGSDHPETRSARQLAGLDSSAK